MRIQAAATSRTWVPRRTAARWPLRPRAALYARRVRPRCPRAENVYGGRGAVAEEGRVATRPPPLAALRRRLGVHARRLRRPTLPGPAAGVPRPAARRGRRRATRVLADKASLQPPPEHHGQERRFGRDVSQARRRRSRAQRVFASTSRVTGASTVLALAANIVAWSRDARHRVLALGLLPTAFLLRREPAAVWKSNFRARPGPTRRRLCWRGPQAGGGRRARADAVELARRRALPGPGEVPWRQFWHSAHAGSAGDPNNSRRGGTHSVGSIRSAGRRA